jgi:hypothetical protein
MLKICIVCGREYECHDRPKKGHGGSGIGSGRIRKSKRPFNSKTCSPKCSITYLHNSKYYRKLADEHP